MYLFSLWRRTVFIMWSVFTTTVAEQSVVAMTSTVAMTQVRVVVTLTGRV